MNLVTQAVVQTMSSREIARLTGSTHDNVLKTIRRMIERGVVSGNETPYINPQNGQTYSEFILDFKNTMKVVSGYSDELRGRIIDRWQELEEAQKQRHAIPQTLSQALLLASQQAAVIEEQQATLAIATPKAEAFDDLTSLDGLMRFRDAAKSLGIKEERLNQLLLDLDWMSRITDPNDKRRTIKIGTYSAISQKKVVNKNVPTKNGSAGVQLFITNKGHNLLKLELVKSQKQLTLGA